MNEFDEILSRSMQSTRETAKRELSKYTNEELLSMEAKRNQEIEKLREKYNNIQLSDAEIMNIELTEYMTTIINLINNDYGEAIPKDRLEKLNKMIEDGVVVKDDITDQHDFSADSDIGKVIVNLATIAKTESDPNPDIYIKMATANSMLAHELFHIIINMLKPKDIADERMIIDLKNGEKVTARGMVGFMLNEGFVEKFSSEFCERNGLYYQLGIQYLPYIEICNYIMNNNPAINSNTIFSLDEADILSTLSEDEQQKYYQAELTSYAIRHAKKDPQEIESSRIEKVDIDYDNIPEDIKSELQNYYYQKNSKLQEMSSLSVDGMHM